MNPNDAMGPGALPLDALAILPIPGFQIAFPFITE